MSHANARSIGILCIPAAGALLAAGCMVGPDYHAPRMDVPRGWVGTSTAPTTQQSITTQQEAQVAQWWTSFNDPILDSLIARAVESNLDLRQATARILQARAARGVVSAGLWPTLDGAASFRRSRSGSLSTGGGSGGGAGATGGGASGGGSATGAGSVTPAVATGSSGSSGGSSVSTTPKPRNFYQAGLDAAWELDLFGGVRRGIEAADADIAATVEDRRAVLVTLTSEVALNYVQLRGLQQQIEIAKRNLEAQRASLRITQERFKAGEKTTRLDVANAEAQVATTQSGIPLLEATAQQTIYTLGVLLGREPGALLAELTPAKAIPSTPPAIPVGLPSDLLRRRPDIRSAEAQLHAATARIGVATADLFPRFSLTGSGGLQSSTLKTFGNWDGHFWSVGPSVSWTIFDAGRIFSNIRVQDALTQQALIAWQRTVLTALQDVESALVAYEKEQQRRDALIKAVMANRIAVEEARKLYLAGETDFLNVLSAQRALLASEDALAQSDRSIASDLIAIYKALGGGWEMQDQGGQAARGH